MVKIATKMQPASPALAQRAIAFQTPPFAEITLCNRTKNVMTATQQMETAVVQSVILKKALIVLVLIKQTVKCAELKSVIRAAHIVITMSVTIAAIALTQVLT